MTGPIAGERLPGEVKSQIVRAIYWAADQGFTLRWACAVIQLHPRRLRRWVRGQNPRSLAPGDLEDAPPVAKVVPHALLPSEREAITEAARANRYAWLRHRKLCHTLSREDVVAASESSVLRVLRAEGLVPAWERRSRPARRKPEVDQSRPNRSWRYDITRVPTRAGDWYWVPIVDGCSRKICGWSFSPRATSLEVQEAWGKALAEEGLLAEEAPEMPDAVSDRGTQMTSRSTKAFFRDLGVAQVFGRPRTPGDNAAAESLIATAKCERLYHEDTWDLSPYQVEELIREFVEHYNTERLHQGIGFVTPEERHTGRHEAIMETRRQAMAEARRRRLEINRERRSTGGARDGSN